MEDLLRNDFTSYYTLPVSSTANIAFSTNLPYIEIEDTIDRELQVHTQRGQGMAKIDNPNRLLISIINYDKFVTGLPNSFQDGLGRCDLIISCNQNRYFILGELKDRTNIKKARKKAREQLIASLTKLIDVPNIFSYINTKTVKRCCYFNKQSKQPSGIAINALVAFNRLPTIFADGFKIYNPVIESFGFEFYEYTGEQTMTLTI